MKNRVTAIIVFIVFALLMVAYCARKVAIRTNPDLKEGITVTVTDKQIVQSVTSSDGNVSTDREYVVFTDKGVFLIEDDYQVMETYGALKKDSTYILITFPTLDFKYKGTIITFTPVKTNGK